MINHQVRLANRPEGLPGDETWSLTEETIGDLDAGQFLVEIHFISLDPAMRLWMTDAPSYIPPVAVGEVMRALGVGRVVASKSDAFAEGAWVSGLLGVQEYLVTDGKGLTKIDPAIAPPQTFLNALGINGLTAYFGLLDVGKPASGETVLVSAAAGGVGAIAGQIAKIKGCRVIGIAGGAPKCAYVKNDLGFDGAIDYKRENMDEALREHCPNGVDVYFDNVGGEILEAALTHLAMNGRVVLCGAISQYNETEIRGPRNYLRLLVQRGRMEGFIFTDYVKQFKTAVPEMGGWFAEGKIKAQEDIVEGGVDIFPQTFLKLFSGENFGKLMIKVR